MCNSVDIDDTLDNFDDIKNHLKSLNLVRKTLFTNKLGEKWKKKLKEFFENYAMIKNITKPLKLHILHAHCHEFIENKNEKLGLGFYSEQTRETIHQRF